MYSMKRTVGLLLILISFVAQKTVLAQSSVSSSTAMPVEVIHPVTGNINRWVSLPGSVKPLQEATLFAKVAGYIKAINVDKGDSVKTGAVLAILETPELSADLSRYRAESEVAKVEYERMQQAVSQAPDLIMPVELDRAKGKYDVAKANLERVQTLLGFSTIRAPFSGVVTQRFVDLGAFIPAATSGSAAASAAVVTVMNFNTVRVHVAVPEAEAALISKGQPVKVSVSGLPGRNFVGKVTRFSFALDDNSKTMLVEIEIPNPKLELRPGMYAAVQIGVEHHDNTLLVPATAVAMEKTNAFAYLANNNNAKKRAIKIGFNDGANVEVLDGVTAAEALIVIGKRPLNDGQPIVIQQPGQITHTESK
jgi:membrane fusion protein (multidrug efflux system)